MDIITIGFATCDIIVSPVTAELFNCDSTKINMQILPGGDAFNVSVNAAALGMNTAIATMVGNDSNGNMILDYLKTNSVCTDAVGVSKSNGTATSIVMVEPGGERHLLTSNTIFSEIGPELIDNSMLEKAGAVCVNSCYRMDRVDYGGIVPVFQKAHEHKALTAMDVVWNRKGDWIESIENALYETDIFIPSYDEAVMITGCRDVTEMAKTMSKYGLKIFGVKMGSEGSYITDYIKEYNVKAFKTDNLVSTLGAGDTFFAGFMTAQIMGMDTYESALFASAAASFTVEVAGAIGGIPNRNAVLKRMHEI